MSEELIMSNYNSTMAMKSIAPADEVLTRIGQSDLCITEIICTSVHNHIQKDLMTLMQLRMENVFSDVQVTADVLKSKPIRCGSFRNVGRCALPLDQFKRDMEALQSYLVRNGWNPEIVFCTPEESDLFAGNTHGDPEDPDDIVVSISLYPSEECLQKMIDTFDKY